MTRYVIDTEFMEREQGIELLSIGIVADDGSAHSTVTYYAENAEADHSHANDWVKENVLPHLVGGDARLPRAQIAAEILEFVTDTSDDDPPTFWAYFGDYDWVVFCQLFGRMVDLPSGWPMMCMDIKQRAVDLGNPRLPEQESTEHHALADACWGLEALNYLDTLLDDTILASGRDDGAGLIRAERLRQISAEGWTAEHDDEHSAGELTKAGLCYIVHGLHRREPDELPNPNWWPWGSAWWKPSPDPVRNLVKGGALVAAEVDRLKRAGG